MVFYADKGVGTRVYGCMTSSKLCVATFSVYFDRIYEVELRPREVTLFFGRRGKPYSMNLFRQETFSSSESWVGVFRDIFDRVGFSRAD